MNTKFSRFNKQQIFTIDKDQFEQGKWLNAKDVYDLDMEQYGELKPHLLIGAWRHEFSEDQRIAGAASYKYTLGVKLEVVDEKTGELVDKYYYVNAPQFMNKTFDEICKDKTCIREINEGRCSICAYEFESRGETRYAFEFC